MNKISKRVKLGITLMSVFLFAACWDSLFVKVMYAYSTANDIEVPAPAPEPMKEFFVTSEEGDEIHTWYYETSKDRPVIVHFHGNGYNIGGAYQGGFFDLFQNFNYNFVMWDYPAYGRSSGKPSEASITSASLAVMAEVKKLFPNQKIFLWGYSLGSAVATKTAYLLQDQVDGLIIAAPWDYSYRVAMELVNFSEKKARKASKGNEWNSADYAKEINVPTFIVHGTKDTLIPHKLGLSLYSNFPEGVARFMSQEGLEHNNLMDRKFWQTFVDFIDGRLE